MKFKVKTKVIATFEIETEVDASGWQKAENMTCSIDFLAAHLPSDFRVASGYCEYETEHEQLTAICPKCDCEHAIPTADSPNATDPASWTEDNEYCAACGLQIEAEAAAMATYRRYHPHRYAETWCSQCGQSLGSGNSGLSHCQDHRYAPTKEVA